jgi:hypothetical protein
MCSHENAVKKLLLVCVLVQYTQKVPMTTPRLTRIALPKKGQVGKVSQQVGNGEKSPQHERH